MLRVENLVPRTRYWVANGVLFLVMILLAGRFYYLQVYLHRDFSLKADINRIRAVTIPAPRGLILDRNGEILVDNYPTYILYGITSEMRSINQKFSLISRVTGIDTSILYKNYHNYYQSRFVPTQLAKDLTFKQLSRIEESKDKLDGVVYKQFPERIYNRRVHAAHVLGFLREIDSRTLKKLDGSGKYEIGDLIGWNGLEKQYESILRGTKGVNYYQVDALGREAGLVPNQGRILPEPGKNLRTTLDINLQSLLEREFRDYRGAAIVSNPVTGEILAFVSSPDYPPDLFRGLVAEEDWNAILKDPDRPLLNRITNGTYPPGSTFKMVVAAALMEQGLASSNYTVNCTGSYTLGDRTFGCWNPTGHGEVDLEQAIVQSCNVFFYKAVQQLGINTLASVARSFGFGSRTHIDLPSESVGQVPDRNYMNHLYGKWGWAKGNLLNIAVGQGEVLVTPLQMMVYINQLATKGHAPYLHLTESVSEIYPFYAAPLLKKGTWQRLERYMEEVINDPKGTGRAANPHLPGVEIAGKTGTAENPHGEPHAWFIGYGKKGAEILSVVLLIENGGHGGVVAAPIAQKVFKQFFHPEPETMAVRSW